MNRGLRRRHRWMVPLVGLVSAVLLVTALRERARMATTNDLSTLDRLAGPPRGAVIIDEVLSADSLLDIALWPDTEDSSRVFLGLRARGALPYPAGQLYWRPAGTSADEAILLGPLAGERWAWFVLPDGPRSGGTVVVYSPALGAATDSGSLPPLVRSENVGR